MAKPKCRVCGIRSNSVSRYQFIVNRCDTFGGAPLYLCPHLCPIHRDCAFDALRGALKREPK